MRTLFFKNTERISEQDKKDMVTIFGNHFYNEFNYTETNDEMDIHHEQAGIIFTIQNNSRLNERDIELRKRIKRTLPKGLTPSSSPYSESVEHNLLEKLVRDAYDQLKREDDDYTGVINWYEIFRYYGLPYKHSLYKKDLEKAKNKTKDVTKPKKFHNWKCYYSKDQTHSNDCNSSYLQYHIDLDYSAYGLSNLNGNRDLYTKFPYLGKIYHTGDYLQVYVYDYVDRHWAINNVLDYLLNKGFIKLKEDE